MVATKKKRLERSKAVIAAAAAVGWENVLRTDEKIFTVEAKHNPQNTRGLSQQVLCLSPHSTGEVRGHKSQHRSWSGLGSLQKASQT